MNFTPLEISGLGHNEESIQTPNIAIAIDTSGSIYRNTFFSDMIKNSVKQIINSLSNQTFYITIWAFDTKVHHNSIKTILKFKDSNLDDEEFEQELNTVISFGGGGSVFNASFHLVNSIFEPLDHLTDFIIITDGMLSGENIPLNDTLTKKHVVLLHELNSLNNPENKFHYHAPFEHSLHVVNYTLNS